MTKRPIAISRRLPSLGPDPDYSRFIYADPPSHDFCVGLIIADLMRQYHGAEGPLKVRLAMINNQLGVVDFAKLSLMSNQANHCGLSSTYSRQMIANVLRPAIAMIGAIAEPVVHLPIRAADYATYVEYDYHIGHLVDAGRQGHKIPRWTPPQWAVDEVKAYLKGGKPVVITLRETGAQLERNSNVEAWMEFAFSLAGDYGVLFIRDTCKAAEPLLPFTTWPRASRNAYVRAALYQQAALNLMVCNGPNTWAIFGNDTPYLIFKELIPTLPEWDHGNAKGWREQDHMEIGDQYPWATDKQRLTWTDDTFENIKAAFEELNL